MRLTLTLPMAALLLATLPIPAQNRAPRGQHTPQFDEMTMMAFEKQLKQDGVQHMIPSHNAEQLVLRRVEPSASHRGKSGHGTATVVVAFEISRQGKVLHATAVSGPKQLQPTAISAIEQWVFKPYIQHGQPVPVGTSIQLQVATQ